MTILTDIENDYQSIFLFVSTDICTSIGNARIMTCPYFKTVDGFESHSKDMEVKWTNDRDQLKECDSLLNTCVFMIRTTNGILK